MDTQQLTAAMQNLNDQVADLSKRLADYNTGGTNLTSRVVQTEGQLTQLHAGVAAHDSCLQGLTSRVAALETRGPVGGKTEILMDRRDLREVKSYGGDTKAWHSWKGAVELFLERYDSDYRGILEWIEQTDEEDISTLELASWAGNTTPTSVPDITALIDELFHLLAVKTEKLPQVQVMNSQKEGALRGAIAWKRLTETAAGAADSRRQGLISLVNNPAKVKTYAEVLPALEELERHFAELDRCQSTKLSEASKVASVRKLMPVEPANNCMSQAMHLDTYPRLRNYIVQQVSMRRESLIETNFMKPAVPGNQNASQKPVAM